MLRCSKVRFVRTAIIVCSVIFAGISLRSKSPKLRGVPAFYGWLCQKYPSIIVDIDVEEGSVPQNWQPVDNLYVDMNGIIHPCCHPENDVQPKSEKEMMDRLKKLIEDLVMMNKPRNLLYLAIDGVAPRAKMNQQRARRFKAARDRVQKEQIENKIRNEMQREGLRIPPQQKAWDHNVISPGTEFMSMVAETIRDYVSERIQKADVSSPWYNLKVLFSDARVCGEGEHKIMQLVRQQRSLDGYNPNTRHVIVGEDADLIMLALATHEPHFGILRVKQTVGNQCPNCFKYGHKKEKCLSEALKAGRKYQIVDIPHLRSFLKGEYLDVNVPSEHKDKKSQNVGNHAPIDLERIIDDFVCMCIFVGNDFLPHLPGLEIREGALDLLMREYSKIVQNYGYLTTASELNRTPAVELLRVVAKAEGNTIRYREEKYQQREKKKSTMCRFYDNSKVGSCRDGASCRYSHSTRRDKSRGNQENRAQKQRFYDRLRESLRRAKQQSVLSRRRHGQDRFHNRGPRDQYDKRFGGNMVKSEYERMIQEAFQDRVKTELKQLSSNFTAEPFLDPSHPDFEKIYYRSKFGENVTETLKKKISDDYITGIRWVLQYYSQRCSSWEWYYPYYYAPLAKHIFQRLRDYSVDDFKLQRESIALGEPLKPIHQLMAIQPRQSSSCIPLAYRNLMTDPNSPILDFFPTNFRVERERHKPDWLAVCCLPFIDKKLLLRTLKDYDHKLTEEEVTRNSEGINNLFLGKGSSNLTEDDFSTAYYGLGGNVRRLSNYHFAYEYPTFKAHDSRLLPGLIQNDDVIKAKKSQFLSPAAQRLLSDFSSTQDKQRMELENMEAAPVTVEEQMMFEHFGDTGYHGQTAGKIRENFRHHPDEFRRDMKRRLHEQELTM